MSESGMTLAEVNESGGGGGEVNAQTVVLNMMSDFEAKTGKLPTQVKLAPLLYDSLKAELKAQLPPDVEIDFIELHGVRIQRGQS